MTEQEPNEITETDSVLCSSPLLNITGRIRTEKS